MKLNDALKLFTTLALAVGICLGAINIFAKDADLCDVRKEVRIVANQVDKRFMQDDILFLQKLIFAKQQEINADPNNRRLRLELFELQQQLNRKMQEYSNLKPQGG